MSPALRRKPHGVAAFSPPALAAAATLAFVCFSVGLLAGGAPFTAATAVSSEASSTLPSRLAGGESARRLGASLSPADGSQVHAAAGVDSATGGVAGGGRANEASVGALAQASAASGISGLGAAANGAGVASSANPGRSMKAGAVDAVLDQEVTDEELEQLGLSTSETSDQPPEILKLLLWASQHVRAAEQQHGGVYGAAPGAGAGVGASRAPPPSFIEADLADMSASEVHSFASELLDAWHTARAGVESGNSDSASFGTDADLGSDPGPGPDAPLAPHATRHHPLTDMADAAATAAAEAAASAAESASLAQSFLETGESTPHPSDSVRNEGFEHASEHDSAHDPAESEISAADDALASAILIEMAAHVSGSHRSTLARNVRTAVSMFSGKVGVDQCVACIYMLQRMWFELEPIDGTKRPAVIRHAPYGVNKTHTAYGHQAAFAPPPSGSGSGSGAGSPPAEFLEVSQSTRASSSSSNTRSNAADAASASHAAAELKGRPSGYPSLSSDFYRAAHPARTPPSSSSGDRLFDPQSVRRVDSVMPMHPHAYALGGSPLFDHNADPLRFAQKGLAGSRHMMASAPEHGSAGHAHAGRVDGSSDSSSGLHTVAGAGADATASKAALGVGHDAEALGKLWNSAGSFRFAGAKKEGDVPPLPEWLSSFEKDGKLPTDGAKYDPHSDPFAGMRGTEPGASAFLETGEATVPGAALHDAMRSNWNDRRTLFGSGQRGRGVTDHLAPEFSTIEKGTDMKKSLLSPTPDQAGGKPGAAGTAADKDALADPGKGTVGPLAGGDIPIHNATLLADVVDPGRELFDNNYTYPAIVVYPTSLGQGDPCKGIKTGCSAKPKKPSRSKPKSKAAKVGSLFSSLFRKKSKTGTLFLETEGQESGDIASAAPPLDSASLLEVEGMRASAGQQQQGIGALLGTALSAASGNWYPLPHMCRPGKPLCRQRLRQPAKYDLLRRIRRERLRSKKTNALFSFISVFDRLCRAPDPSRKPTKEELELPGYPGIKRFSRSRFHGHLDDRTSYVTYSTPYGDVVGVGAFEDYHFAKVYRKYCPMMRSKMPFIVDLYLHLYQDEEICTQLDMCDAKLLHTFAPSVPTSSGGLLGGLSKLGSMLRK